MTGSADPMKGDRHSCTLPSAIRAPSAHYPRTIRAAALLFEIARSRWMGRLVGWVFAHMSFAIPVRRLRETATLLAFYHPRPAYPVHILIVPRRSIASLLDLGPADADFLADLVATAQSLVRELGLEEKGYRLVANGGANQDVQQLHFHLIAGG